MTWTFKEALESARAMLDRDYDWCRASLSLSYATETGWFYDLHIVELMGHIKRFETTFSVGTYEDLVKE